MKRKNSWVAGVGVAGALVLATSACNGDASGGSASSSADPAAIKQAESDYQTLQDASTQDYKFPASTTPAPTGKTVDIIDCPIPVCAVITQSAKDAAEKLGWKVKVVTNPGTPEGFTGALDIVAQDKPDVLMAAGAVPLASVTDQLQALADAGTIITSYSWPDTVGGTSPVSINAIGIAEFEEMAVAQATAAIAIEHGPPNVVVVTDLTNPAWPPMTASTEKAIEAVGGAVDTLDVSLQNIGQSVPGEIVTYLQAHPEVEYILPAIDDFLSGVPEAISAAGLQVTIVGNGASESSLPLVESGVLATSIVDMTGAYGYILMDAAARIMTDQPIDDPNPVPQLRAAATKDNLDDFEDVTAFPSNTADEFAKTWGVS